MTDLMDRRLAAAARRWQAEQPAPPAVPLDRLGEVAGRRPGWRAALATAAAVVLVGGAAAVVLRATGTVDAPPADSPSSSTPRVHALGPIVPWRALPAGHPHLVHRVHGKPVTKYDGIVATGEISGHLHPGDTLTFTVVLESIHGLTLDPCPDYTIAFGANYARTWRLNCAQDYLQRGVLARRHGRVDHSRLRHAVPVLPAGRKVRFEMKVTVPDEPGRQKVLWTLDGPQELPGFYGLVDVSRG